MNEIMMKVYSRGVIEALKDCESLNVLPQVIHLVRDPRARYNSLRRSPGDFKAADKNFSENCQMALDDLEIEKDLPKSRYKL